MHGSPFIETARIVLAFVGGVSLAIFVCVLACLLILRFFRK